MRTGSGVPTNLNPDTRPLTGVQNSTLGTPGIRYSYWCQLPVRRLPSGQARLNKQLLWVGIRPVLSPELKSAGGLEPGTARRNYSGGEAFPSDSAQGNSHFQQLGLLEMFDWGRWQLHSSTSFRISRTQFGFVLEQLCPSPAQVVLLPPPAGLQIVIYPTKHFHDVWPPLRTPLQLKRLHNQPEDQSRQRARTASFVLSKQETSRVIMQLQCSVTTTF